MGDNTIYLDFGHGPEPAVARTIDGRRHYVSLREHLEDMQVWLRSPVIDEPKWQEMTRRVGSREFA